MFDTTSFDLNNTLIDECKKLINEHNEISYTRVSLQMETVQYTHITKTIPKDTMSNELITFYEIFTHQKIVAYNLQQIINSIDYTHEDLITHIDRSDDTILQLMSSLTGIRLKLIDFHSHIEENINKQTDVFIDYVSSQTIQDISTFIDVLFICMDQANIERYIKIEANSKYFVAPGAKILEKLYNQINKYNLSGYVRTKVNALKQSILSIKPQLQTPYEAINKLQTFNLVPNDGDSKSIKEVMNALFKISIDANDLMDSMQTIETALKQLSVGLFIISSSNNDIYFDMSPLATMVQVSQSAGINSDLINKSNLIKIGKKSSIKKSELITINVDSNTTTAYILWTNDMQTFKVRYTPIDNSTIVKILRRTPSTIIESYNYILTDIINKLKKYDDAIAFKKVQYMAFNNSVTEESFIQLLKQEIASHKDKLHEWIAGKDFTEELLNIIDALKDKIGIDRHLLSAHCHIIYNSMAVKIINKLKRKLIANATLTDAINDAVDGNDNIYTRTIASYYLHIA